MGYYLPPKPPTQNKSKSTTGLVQSQETSSNEPQKRVRAHDEDEDSDDGYNLKRQRYEHKDFGTSSYSKEGTHDMHGHYDEMGPPLHSATKRPNAPFPSGGRTYHSSQGIENRPLSPLPPVPGAPKISPGVFPASTSQSSQLHPIPQYGVNPLGYGPPPQGHYAYRGQNHALPSGYSPSMPQYIPSGQSRGSAVQMGGYYMTAPAHNLPFAHTIGYGPRFVGTAYPAVPTFYSPQPQYPNIVNRGEYLQAYGQSGTGDAGGRRVQASGSTSERAQSQSPAPAPVPATATTQPPADNRTTDSPFDEEAMMRRLQEYNNEHDKKHNNERSEKHNNK